ncbi:UDP-N-acetyl-D-glucosamine dehydrogenase [Parcubacteria bacterium DG_74_1]|nr:MAG: UDP-N-acetyl-D-glucosamine dehydrogenase [Parcubacteria bacterium DG_74_1]
MTSLTDLIKTKKAKVAVIGLGYVGLPTAVELTKAGYQVFGIDIKKQRVDSVNKGKSYILDISSKELKEVIKNKKLAAFNNYLPLKKANIILICVPTPLDKNKNPDISYILSTTKEVAKYLRKEQLIILESSTYPETTQKVILPALAKNKLKVGKHFFLAHCPERLDPGNEKYRLKDVSRAVGGITKECTRLAAEFYRSFIEAQVFPLSSATAAEMTKILENTFRLVNISMINELALLVGRMGIDIWEVIEAAKTKPYGFMPFYPSPKCAGHCIPITPFFLNYTAKRYNFWTKFIDLAGEINEQMPHYVMTKIIWVLNLKGKAVRKAKVLVWGASYKGDIGDTRESAAFDIIADLIRKGARVDYFDPFVKKLYVEHRILKRKYLLRSIKYSLKKIKEYDLVLILTDHSGFDYDKLAKKSKLVVDTRNAIKSRRHKNVFRL